MQYLRNIDDVGDAQTSGKALGYTVYLVGLSQLDKAKPFPKPNMNREISALTLKKGEQMMYLEAHDIPTLNSKGERGDITATGTNTMQLVIGGSRDEVLTFVERNIGGKFLVLFQECGKDELYLLGSACKPMILKSFDHKNDKDGRYVTLTFENNSLQQYVKYTGPLLLTESTAENPDGTELRVKAGVDVYIIPGSDNPKTIATVSGLTSSDSGRMIILRGGAGSKAAKIDANTVFVLESGKAWNAKPGAELTLRVLSANQLVEQSRIEG